VQIVYKQLLHDIARAQFTLQDTAARKEADPLRKAAARIRSSPDHFLNTQAADRWRSGNRRLTKKALQIMATALKARHSSAILTGTQIIDYLNIVPLTNADQTPQKECDKCHAFE